MSHFQPALALAERGSDQDERTELPTIAGIIRSLPGSPGLQGSDHAEVLAYLFFFFFLAQGALRHIQFGDLTF